MDPRDAERDFHAVEQPEPEPEPTEPEPADDGPGIADAPADLDQPTVFPNDNRSYRIWQLSVGTDGSVRGGQREQLPKQVYGRAVALRWLAYYAKQLDADALLVLLDVNNSVVAVAQGGTGRLKPTLRREVKKILTQQFNVARAPSARRTSRPARPGASRPAAAGNRRTSRRPGRR